MSEKHTHRRALGATGHDKNEKRQRILKEL